MYNWYKGIVIYIIMVATEVAKEIPLAYLLIVLSLLFTPGVCFFISLFLKRTKRYYRLFWFPAFIGGILIMLLSVILFFKPTSQAPGGGDSPILAIIALGLMLIHTPLLVTLLIRRPVR
jgi:hypothetical protein